MRLEKDIIREEGYNESEKIKFNTYCKARKKISLCNEKITNTRKDYLHKISHEIISENQVIVSENL